MDGGTDIIAPTTTASLPPRPDEQLDLNSKHGRASSAQTCEQPSNQQRESRRNTLCDNEEQQFSESEQPQPLKPQYPSPLRRRRCSSVNALDVSNTVRSIEHSRSKNLSTGLLASLKNVLASPEPRRRSSSARTRGDYEVTSDFSIQLRNGEIRRGSDQSTLVSSSRKGSENVYLSGGSLQALSLRNQQFPGSLRSISTGAGSDGLTSVSTSTLTPSKKAYRTHQQRISQPISIATTTHFTNTSIFKSVPGDSFDRNLKIFATHYEVPGSAPNICSSSTSNGLGQRRGATGGYNNIPLTHVREASNTRSVRSRVSTEGNRSVKSDTTIDSLPGFGSGNLGPGAISHDIISTQVVEVDEENAHEDYAPVPTNVNSVGAPRPASLNMGRHIGRKIIIASENPRARRSNFKGLLDSISHDPDSRRRWSLSTSLWVHQQLATRRQQRWNWDSWKAWIQERTYRWYSLRNVLALSNVIILITAILTVSTVTYWAGTATTESAILALSKLVLKNVEIKMDQMLYSAEQSNMVTDAMLRIGHMQLSEPMRTMEYFYQTLILANTGVYDDSVYAADSSGNFVSLSRYRRAETTSVEHDLVISYSNQDTGNVRKAYIINSTCLQATGFTCIKTQFNNLPAPTPNPNDKIYDPTAKAFFQVALYEERPAWTNVYILSKMATGVKNRDVLGITHVRPFNLPKPGSEDPAGPVASGDFVLPDDGSIPNLNLTDIQGKPTVSGDPDSSEVVPSRSLNDEPITNEANPSSDTKQPSSAKPSKIVSSLSSDSTVVGVAAIDISLIGLSEFLETVALSALENNSTSISIFIIEKSSGYLVSSSNVNSVRLIDETASSTLSGRIRAHESENEMIAKTSRAVLDKFGAYENVVLNDVSSASLYSPHNNEQYILQTPESLIVLADYSQFSKDIQWLVVLNIPVKTFRDELSSLFFTNVLTAVILTLLFSVLMSVSITRLIGRPIKKAAQKMLKIADLDFDMDMDSMVTLEGENSDDDNEETDLQQRRGSDADPGKTKGDVAIDIDQSDKNQSLKKKKKKKSSWNLKLKEVDLIDHAMSSMTSGLKSFSKYVPMDVVALLVKMKREAVLGVDENMLTIFFSDIADFTSIAESMKPRELVKLMSEYFEEMSSIILDSQGLVDKYIGDAIMAFWNAPLYLEDHARVACYAAIRSQKRLAELRDEWIQRGYPAIRARIGIHTGLALVGNLGSRTRINYTCLGDSVNLASRLEGLNKYYGTSIIISDSTYSYVYDEFVCRPLDIVAVKGKNCAVKVWELVDTKANVAPEMKSVLDNYQMAFEWFVKGERLEEACQGFRNYLRMVESDRAAAKHLRACERMLREGVPAGWSCVLVLDEK